MDEELKYEWSSLLCIVLKSGNIISINTIDRVVDLLKPDKIFSPKFEDNKTFQKLSIGKRPGSLWYKLSDWEASDYSDLLDDELVMYRLKNEITPNPEYIDEMISTLRDLKIKKILK